MNVTMVNKLVNTCRTPLLLVPFISSVKQEYKYLGTPITVTANKWNARHVPVHKANIWVMQLIDRLMRKQLVSLFKPTILYNFLYRHKYL
jgi:hypothetical protein